MWPMAAVPGRRASTSRREEFLHQAHALFEMQLHAIGRDDAGGFLAAMLQSVKAKIGELGGLFVTEDAEDAAVVVKVIVVEMECAIHSFPKRVFERGGPDLAKRIHGGANSWLTVQLDAEFAASDLANLARCDLILCRNREHAGK